MVSKEQPQEKCFSYPSAVTLTEVCFVNFLPSFIDYLHYQAENFSAGRLLSYSTMWRQLTNDAEIINMVRGTRIEFDCSEEILPQFSRQQPCLSPAECKIIDAEVEKLQGKKVISLCNHCQGEVLSSVFTRRKKDDSFRMILNLKRLNNEVTYHHFKMDTLAQALQLITKDCFMASIDLKDAYYSVPVDPEHKKYLRFEWNENLYEFNALPNGLALAPRKFTRLLKPVFAKLRESGHVSTSFLDDSLLIGRTPLECMRNVIDTTKLFDSLGFVIHPTKSVFLPSKEIQYLGVIINSETMKVKLTTDRANSLVSCCKTVQKKQKVSIREVAKAVGMIVASFIAVKFGPLHYRTLEEDKKSALKSSKGCFDCDMSLSPMSKQELQWWIDNTYSSDNAIYQSDPDVVISSDASSTIGWGCQFRDKRTGGLWSSKEKCLHINCLELKAALFALQTYVSDLQQKHVRMLIDNTTAVACINHMGTSHSLLCNSITQEIWNFCIEHNMWVSAAFIPSKSNVVADEESRSINVDAEWMLNKNLFNNILDKFEIELDIDLFASRLNTQLTKYVSFRPDPGAFAVDAFSLSWSHLKFYAFPPFCMISRVLRKVVEDQAQGVIVVPDWPTQSWYPMLSKLTQCDHHLTAHQEQLLQLPSHPHLIHHLEKEKRLRLRACLIWGKLFWTQV